MDGTPNIEQTGFISRTAHLFPEWVFALIPFFVTSGLLCHYVKALSKDRRRRRDGLGECVLGIVESKKVPFSMSF